MTDQEPGLLQLRRGAGDAWKTGVICILLGQSSWKQVEPVLTPLFRMAPCADVMAALDRAQITSVIHTVGLQNTKADRIIKFSQDTVDGFPFQKRRGVGKYARDCYALLIEGDIDRGGVDDYALRRWQEWALRQRRRDLNDTMETARR